ncbi:His/Gly/Thr/Pro-type tRNA ligase C-terminal domain-containing protein [Haloarchaeobius sp. DT45]|uniref:His/Gly/Thr/Pro-type tRNA ligase C-terminal domain-containing protein n=1 Tax=Haloarchaeobius sp. DT45 TaxID=3446116 RepID=UPI003F6A65A4
MRLLCIHSDRFAFEAATAATDAAAARGPPTPRELSDCLTVAVTVETGDLADGLTEEAAAEVRAAADQLNTPDVALVATDHLSDAAADSDTTARALDALGAALEADYSVLRAPADWFLAVDLQTKGHPHAVRSRHVTAADVSGEPDRGASDWRILTPDGGCHNPGAVPASLADAMARFVERAVAADPIPGDADQTARTVATRLREGGFASVDSDHGSVRYTPRGSLVRQSIRAVVADLAAEDGAMAVESVPGVGVPTGTDDGTTRALLQEWDAPDSALPVTLFETRTAPARGGTPPLPDHDRGAATVPTLTTVCRDESEARTEFRALARLTARAHETLDLEPLLVLRTTRAFHDAAEAWGSDLASTLDRPVLLELRPGSADWAARLDVVAEGRTPVQTGTVRLEPGRGSDGDSDDADDAAEHDGRPVVHCEPVGSVEQAMAALLARAAATDRPRLPTWLSPTQVRFVPVEDDHLERCDELAETAETAGLRADVDDRTDETVGARLADATADWVPYVAVVGDREADGNPLKVQQRETGTEASLSIDELVDRVLAETDGTPRRRWTLPKRVSRHPRFDGRA